MFVVIEGPNGTGKTTLIKNLAEEGYRTLSSPAGTPLAQHLRPACRGVAPWEDIDKRIQFLLFSAARMDEYLRIVKDSSTTVVADRWWISTYVYQCKLQGIPIDFLHHTIPIEEKIDLVILLTADFSILRERAEAERKRNPLHGHCTWSKDEQVMQKVYDIYKSDLPAFLHQMSIPFDIYDTSELTQKQILGIVKRRIGYSEIQKESDK